MCQVFICSLITCFISPPSCLYPQVSKPWVWFVCTMTFSNWCLITWHPLTWLLIVCLDIYFLALGSGLPYSVAAGRADRPRPSCCALLLYSLWLDLIHEILCLFMYKQALQGLPPCRWSDRNRGLHSPKKKIISASIILALQFHGRFLHVEYFTDAQKSQFR